MIRRKIIKLRQTVENSNTQIEEKRRVNRVTAQTQQDQYDPLILNKRVIQEKASSIR